MSTNENAEALAVYAREIMDTQKKLATANAMIQAVENSAPNSHTLLCDLKVYVETMNEAGWTTGQEVLRRAFARIVALEGDVVKVRQENDTLRGLLGNSAQPCPYCGLAAEDQGKCALGFSGCARADDQMLSKHFGDAHRADQAEKELAAEREAMQKIVAETTWKYTTLLAENVRTTVEREELKRLWFENADPEEVPRYASDFKAWNEREIKC